MKYLHLIIFALAGALTVPAIVAVGGCASVAKEGVYAGDKTLLTADSTLAASFSVIDAFLRFELENRATIGRDATTAADFIRANARKWRDSYFALRDAYAISPTADNRTAMQRSLAVIAAGAAQAQVYLK